MRQKVIEFRSLLKQIIIIRNYKYIILNINIRGKKIQIIFDFSI
jgi:hypothetical protein